VALWQVWHRGAAWRVGAALYALLIAFSAVYLAHHYVLDVLAGWTVALAACGVLDAGALFLARARGAPRAAGRPALAPSGDTHA
jgi:inositol phosphorylceramide synthase catalytic subunit